LLAFQIAQELSENENRVFINQIIVRFPIINLSDCSEAQRNIETTIKPQLLKILNGKLTEELSLSFLNLKNQTDKQIIANIKAAGDNKNSILHEAAIISNSIFQAGTTNQSFMVENLGKKKGRKI
jgi:26S proteasome regulatory subunit N2